MNDYYLVHPATNGILGSWLRGATRGSLLLRVDWVMSRTLGRGSTEREGEHRAVESIYQMPRPYINPVAAPTTRSRLVRFR